MKLLIVLALLLTPCAVNAAKRNVQFADVRLTHLEPKSSDATWVREDQTSPLYPVAYAKRGVSACGIFNVVVNAQGKTESVELIKGVPENLIYRPSRAIMRDWKWVTQPGKVAKQEQKTLRLDYCLAGNSIGEAQIICAIRAQEECK